MIILPPVWYLLTDPVRRAVRRIRHELVVAWLWLWIATRALCCFVADAMTRRRRATALAVCGVCCCCATWMSPAAASEPAIDRALVERLVRAVEAQTGAIQAQTRAIERCSK